MIKKEEVQHIVKLARLGITKKEEQRFQKDLSSILDYFNSLKEVDVSGVEPTFHPVGFPRDKVSSEETCFMREDKGEVRSSESATKLIEAAPEKKERHIKVKAILQ